LARSKVDDSRSERPLLAAGAYRSERGGAATARAPSAPPCARRRDGAPGRALGCHPAPARARQPRRHVHLPCRHRQLRNHPRGPLASGPGDPGNGWPRIALGQIRAGGQYATRPLSALSGDTVRDSGPVLRYRGSREHGQVGSAQIARFRSRAGGLSRRCSPRGLGLEEELRRERREQTGYQFAGSV
jgi:hypothetical protein